MEERLREAVGLADLCELMSVAFAFPTADLAEALTDGSFAGDLSACLEDVGRAELVTAVDLVLRRFSDKEPAALFEALRKAHSLIYLVPGGKTPVWPYEAAFMFVASGREGEPPLFRSACQIDVERHMREAGVLPKDARTEPTDSVWSELSFMAYLYGNVAKSLHEGNEADAEMWSRRVVRFWDAHASKWLPSFVEKTAEEAPKCLHGEEYVALAEAYSMVLDVINDDVESRKKA